MKSEKVPQEKELKNNREWKRAQLEVSCYINKETDYSPQSFKL